MRFREQSKRSEGLHSNIKGWETLAVCNAYTFRRKLSCRRSFSCGKKSASEADSCWAGKHWPCSPSFQSLPSYPPPAKYAENIILPNRRDASPWPIGLVLKVQPHDYWKLSVASFTIIIQENATICYTLKTEFTSTKNMVTWPSLCIRGVYIKSGVVLMITSK